MNDSDSIEDQLRNDFPPPVRDAIVAALKTSYSDAQEKHDPLVGSDGLTFGISVYSFTCFRLAQRLDGSDGVALISRHPTFRLKIGRFVVGAHRVSSDEGDEIAETFPPNQNAAGRLCGPQQMPMPFPGHEPLADVKPDGGIIIAHVGNPDVGLAAVYLAMPESVDEQNRIDGWRYTERIWSRNGGGPSGDRKPILVVVPPPEVVPEPVVRRRSKSGEGA